MPSLAARLRRLLQFAFASAAFVFFAAQIMIGCAMLEHMVKGTGDFVGGGHDGLLGPKRLLMRR